MSEDNKTAKPLTEAQLSKKEADLKVASDKLAEAKKAFEAEKKAFETEKENFKSPEAEATVNDFEFEGEKYAFAPNAGKSIRFGGQKFTRQELLANEEVLMQLIGGKSTLIKKVD